jgi:hypothetical protein
MNTVEGKTTWGKTGFFSFFFLFCFETGPFYAAQAGLKLLLPQPLKCWD